MYAKFVLFNAYSFSMNTPQPSVDRSADLIFTRAEHPLLPINLVRPHLQGATIDQIQKGKTDSFAFFHRRSSNCQHPRSPNRTLSFDRLRTFFFP